MITSKFKFGLVLFVFALMTACVAEDGDTGPVGPVGPPGPSGGGPVGPPGEDGTDGKDGSANVSSTFYTVLSTEWTGTTVKTHTISAPELTQAVIDSGAVIIYQKEDSVSTVDGMWSSLPYSFMANLNGPNGSIAVEFTIRGSYEAGNLHLSIINSYSANVTFTNSFPGTRSFKLVVIPPSSMIKDVDHNNLEMVEAVYGLE